MYRDNGAFRVVEIGTHRVEKLLGEDRDAKLTAIGAVDDCCDHVALSVVGVLTHTIMCLERHVLECGTCLAE